MVGWSDLIFNPFWTGANAVWDTWVLAFGDVRSKAATIGKYGGFVGSTDQSGWIKQQINTAIQKNPSLTAFYTTPYIMNTTTETPGAKQFGEIWDFLTKYGLWVIVGVIALFVILNISRR